MSSSLRIPPEHRAVFVAVVALPDESFSALAKVVSEVGPGVTARKAFVAQLAGAVPEIDADELVSAMLGAYLTMDRYRWTPQRLAERLGELGGDKAVAVERMSILMESAALRHIAKPLALLTDNEHNYRAARILTDIRPVFDEVTADPFLTVLVHNLRIEYRDPAGHIQAITFALDSRDVVHLLEVLKREEAKLTTLRRMLTEPVPLPVFEPEDGDTE